MPKPTMRGSPSAPSYSPTFTRPESGLPCTPSNTCPPWDAAWMEGTSSTAAAADTAVEEAGSILDNFSIIDQFLDMDELANGILANGGLFQDLNSHPSIFSPDPFWTDKEPLSASRTGQQERPGLVVASENLHLPHNQPAAAGGDAPLDGWHDPGARPMDLQSTRSQQAMDAWSASPRGAEPPSSGLWSAGRHGMDLGMDMDSHPLGGVPVPALASSSTPGRNGGLEGFPPGYPYQQQAVPGNSGVRWYPGDPQYAGSGPVAVESLAALPSNGRCPAGPQGQAPVQPPIHHGVQGRAGQPPAAQAWQPHSLPSAQLPQSHPSFPPHHPRFLAHQSQLLQQPQLHQANMAQAVAAGHPAPARHQTKSSRPVRANRAASAAAPPIPRPAPGVDRKQSQLPLGLPLFQQAGPPQADDYDPLTGKYIGPMRPNPALWWNPNSLAAHGHYPPLGLRNSSPWAGPNHAVYAPYGAPLLDEQGVPQPTYPPVEVATSPVPAYGSPEATADGSALLVNCPPLTGDEMAEGGVEMAGMPSPSYFLDLGVPVDEGQTEMARPLVNDGSADIPVDPQMELSPDLEALLSLPITDKDAPSMEWNANEPAQLAQAAQFAMPDPYSALAVQQEHAVQEVQPGGQLLAHAGADVPQAHQAALVFGQQDMCLPAGGYPLAAYRPRKGLVNAFGFTIPGDDVKIDNSRNAKKKKDPLSDPLRVYSTPVHPLPAFGPPTADGRPLFTYSRQCQLAQGRAYTTDELRRYVDSGRCVMWVQQAPSQCADRMDDDDKKCRWASCPISARSISSGWLRVGLDEFPHLTSDGSKDPFKMAGLMHLWCFEQIFDVVEFYASGRLLPDERHLPRETTNTMALNRDTDRDIVSEAWDKWFLAHSAAYACNGPVTRPREHRDSLSYTLIRYHLDNQTTARQRARTNRNQDKETELQKTIDIHVGDLGLFARVSRNCRSTAKNAAKARSEPEPEPEPVQDQDMAEAEAVAVAHEMALYTVPEMAQAAGPGMVTETAQPMAMAAAPVQMTVAEASQMMAAGTAQMVAANMAMGLVCGYDDDSAMTESTPNDAWSTAAEETPGTEPDSPAGAAKRPKSVKGKQAEAPKAPQVANSPPAKAKTTRSVRGSKNKAPSVGSKTAPGGSKGGAKANNGRPDLAELFKMEADGPVYDLLNPSTWGGATAAPAAAAPSAMHEYFNPLGSPFAGIVAPAVMESPLKNPVVRGSIVARRLSAQEATKGTGVGKTGGKRQQRGWESDDVPSVLGGNERPAKRQYAGPLSPKRKRGGESDEAGEGGAAPPSPKRQRTEQSSASAQGRTTVPAGPGEEGIAGQAAAVAGAGADDAARLGEARNEGGDALGPDASSFDDDLLASSFDSLFDEPVPPSGLSLDGLFGGAF